MIDLYQNIFVTPHHIKQNVSSDVVTNFASNGLDVDFKQFFDKLESGQKIDWTKYPLKEEGDLKSDFDVLLEKPKVLVPKVFTEPNTDPEDLISEVLTQINIEKRILEEYNYRPNVEDNSKSKTKSDSNLNNNFFKDSNIENINTDNMASGSTKNIPIDNQINNSFTFTVQAMQKDEKVYKKKRVLKPANQTSKFTKGPDINEKTVVLPQIMARIIARQEYLDEVNSQKKRLILDAGEVVTHTPGISNDKMKPPKINSGFATNIVNSDRSSTFKDPEFCLNKVSESIAVHNSMQTCINCNKTTKNGIPGNNSVRLDRNPNLNEAKLYMHSTASVPVNTAKKITTNYNNPSVNFGGASIKTDKGFGANCNNPSVNKVASSFGAASRKTDGFGQVSPKVLMADCNKERLKALKQSQMFKNFVMHGKFEL